MYFFDSVKHISPNQLSCSALNTTLPPASSDAFAKGVFAKLKLAFYSSTETPVCRPKKSRKLFVASLAAVGQRINSCGVNHLHNLPMTESKSYFQFFGNRPIQKTHQCNVLSSKALGQRINSCGVNHFPSPLIMEPHSSCIYKRHIGAIC